MRNMRKNVFRSVSVLLTLALLFGVLTCAPFSIGAAETGDAQPVASAVSTFGEPSGGVYTLYDGLTYQLSEDTLLEGYLLVPSGAAATIDLNGHTLGRELAEASSTGYIILNGVSVLDNEASSDGAGIYVDDGTLVMNGGSVSGNYSGSNGGGIFTDDDAAFTLSNATISGNSSKYAGGGMNIHLKDNSSSITNCTITYNESE